MTTGELRATPRVTGLVLAGGLARRMQEGGGDIDKGLVRFRGEAMVAHVLARLAPQVDRLLINANRNQAEYRGFGHPVVADEIAGYAGPLAGLHAGLQAATTEWVVSSVASETVPKAHHSAARAVWIRRSAWASSRCMWPAVSSAATMPISSRVKIAMPTLCSSPSISKPRAL